MKIVLKCIIRTRNVKAERFSAFATSNPLVPELTAFEPFGRFQRSNDVNDNGVGRMINILLKIKYSRSPGDFSDEVNVWYGRVFRKIGIYSHVGQLYTPKIRAIALLSRISRWSITGRRYH